MYQGYAVPSSIAYAVQKPLDFNPILRSMYIIYLIYIFSLLLLFLPQCNAALSPSVHDNCRAFITFRELLNAPLSFFIQCSYNCFALLLLLLSAFALSRPCLSISWTFRPPRKPEFSSSHRGRQERNRQIQGNCLTSGLAIVKVKVPLPYRYDTRYEDSPYRLEIYR